MFPVFIFSEKDFVNKGDGFDLIELSKDSLTILFLTSLSVIFLFDFFSFSLIS